MSNYREDNHRLHIFYCMKSFCVSNLLLPVLRTKRLQQNWNVWFKLTWQNSDREYFLKFPEEIILESGIGIWKGGEINLVAPKCYGKFFEQRNCRIFHRLFRNSESIESKWDEKMLQWQRICFGKLFLSVDVKINSQVKHPRIDESVSNRQQKAIAIVSSISKVH